jgi:3-oxoacyl-[acyl-carrier protein] reductase
MASADGQGHLALYQESSKMKLLNKVVIVSGGSQGIGEAIARLYAKEGAHVAVVGSSDMQKVQAVADSIRADGGSARPYVCDVRDAAQVTALVARVEGEMGGVDLLLNGAGVFYPTPAGSTPDTDFDRMVDINLKGSWNLINAIVPAMKMRKHGKIICMASVASVYGVPTYALYCATKAAIVQLVRALALELAPHGIHINAIAPGNTASPMNADLRSDAAAVQAIAAATPSGRAFSTVDDIAAIALFLASDDCRAMHGSCLLADEGISAGMAS